MVGDKIPGMGGGASEAPAEGGEVPAEVQPLPQHHHPHCYHHHFFVAIVIIIPPEIQCDHRNHHGREEF